MGDPVHSKVEDNDDVRTKPSFLGDIAIGETIDDIITPSDVCKEIVALIGSAISNFTLCSVTNARPIHLCEWCVENYIRVVEVHRDFLAKTDEAGNPCKEYFLNLDRVEIVSDAYKYVEDLWAKGKCDSCFRKLDNGTLTNNATEEVRQFVTDYERTKGCFDDWLNANITGLNQTACDACKPYYDQMNNKYMEIGELYGENVCVDVLDTMNITRELWSELFQCVPERKAEFWLHIGFGIVATIPLIFYFLAYALSTKQEARVLQQHRLAEVFANTSASGMSDLSGYHSSRLQESTTRSRSMPTTEPSDNCDNIAT
ncbi:Osteopetrosis-associated transmembrane protein 1 [Orchesella cincta]|uniref:Osteopetrosis-associated transmembrane protein 1 n=1 Tax=Orchesella cincta TaxID=48709 RepID=A0A1D2M7Y7_ORCCI|nr:Osteopetrosis-associated transmembrane protein 1 [Orchesella cincta]